MMNSELGAYVGDALGDVDVDGDELEKLALDCAELDADVGAD